LAQATRRLRLYPPPREKLASDPLDDRILAAIDIAKNDPFVPEVLAIITVPDVAFDFSLDTLTVHAIPEGQDNTVGLVFRQAKTINPRLGGDLILTCDLEAKQIVVAHFLIGVSQAHALELHSITVDARDPLIEIYGDLHAPSENSNPRTMRQRLERFWSYPHKDAAPLDPRELIPVGWPPELPEVPRWYYTGCLGAEWTQKDKGIVLQAAQVGKALAGKPELNEVLSLASNELDLRSEVEHNLELLDKQS
jgi:hypothetical protein